MGLMGCFGGGAGRHRRRCGQKNRIPLSEAGHGHTYRVLSNPDRQTLEMGLFHGACIQVIQNSDDRAQMVVGIGDARYMIDKSVADDIIVA
jgi:Fe2+ transport system protein FeoA